MAKVTNEMLWKVFVYGTLKKSQPNHHWLTRPENGKAKFLGFGKTVNEFPLVIATRYNIPFLLDKPGTGHQILGEVYEVDERMFEKLDELEGYPEYYDREVQKIQMNNENINCWLYLIRKFPVTMLQKKFLTSYENTSEQPYCERSRRDNNIRPEDDMAF